MHNVLFEDAYEFCMCMYLYMCTLHGQNKEFCSVLMLETFCPHDASLGKRRLTTADILRSVEARPGPDTGSLWFPSPWRPGR